MAKRKKKMTKAEREEWVWLNQQLGQIFGAVARDERKSKKS